MSGARTLVGVDGCRHAWLAVSRAAPGVPLQAHVFDDALSLLDRYAAGAIVAVDMPLGLTDAGPRTADTLARARLGRGRSVSVFSTPPAAILDVPTRADAAALRRGIDGRGVNMQSFRIFPKIADWRRALLARPSLQRDVYEIHPEVCFAELAGGAIVAPKKSPDGARRRRELLAAHYGNAAIEALAESLPRRRASRDDLHDALVALWSAERIAAGRAVSLPDPPEVDSAGLRRAIWY